MQLTSIAMFSTLWQSTAHLKQEKYQLGKQEFLAVLNIKKLS